MESAILWNIVNKAARMLPPRSLLPLLIWLCTLPFLAYSLVAAPALMIDIGAWGDQAVLAGVNGPEQSSTESYRWTTDHTTITLPQLSTSYRVLELHAHGWRPDGPSPQFSLSVNGQALGRIQTVSGLRVYRLLLPENQALEQRLELQSEAYSPPGDTRVIGVALDWVALRRLAAPAPALPALAMFSMQALFLALVLGLCVALTPKLRPIRSSLQAEETGPQFSTTFVVGLVLSQIALACGLLAMNLVQPLWLSLAIRPWLLIMALLLLLTLLVRVWAVKRSSRNGSGLLLGWLSETQFWLVWAVLVAALGIRLLGAAHPFFDSHDLPVHDRWMHVVVQGQLALYSTPGELQNRLTFNPPAGYVLLLPVWLLLGDLRLAIQLGTALIDWLGCVLLVLIAIRLRLPARAALMALIVYAWLPINMTMLWWGFVTNDMAQTCWLLLLWLILRLDLSSEHLSGGLRDTFWSVAGIAVATTLCLLMHVGALVLLVPMLSLLALTGLVRLSRQAALVLVAGLGIAALVSVILYVSYVLPAVLTQPASAQTRSLAQSLARSLTMTDLRLSLVGQAFSLGFTLPLLAAACVGCVVLLTSPGRHVFQPTLVWGTVVLCVLFFAVYMLLGFLTRYIYFAAPLVCLAAAALLERLRLRPGGRWLVLAVVLLVVFMGIDLWFGAVLLRDKPSLVPLTH